MCVIQINKGMCMRIYNINQYRFNSTFSNSKINESSTPENNLTFRGFSISTFLITQVARHGHEAIKGISSSKKKYQYIKELNSIVDNPNSAAYPDLLFAMSKTPNSLYQENSGWLYWFHGDVPKISELRIKTLKHLSEVPDSNRINIQAKKEFVKSLFDNGHELSQLFLSKFKTLNNALYKSFKEEVIDTCFFSKSYNKIRNSVPPYDSGSLIPTDYRSPYFSYLWLSDYLEKCGVSGATNKTNMFLNAYNNLKLVSSLEKSEYLNYLQQRSSAIQQTKAFILDMMKQIENTGEKDSLDEKALKELKYDYINNLKDL